MSHVHRCAALGCEADIGIERLFCHTHYRMLSRSSRYWLRRAWNFGHPSADYLEVRQRAIDEVDAFLVPPNPFATSPTGGGP